MGLCVVTFHVIFLGLDYICHYRIQPYRLCSFHLGWVCFLFIKSIMTLWNYLFPILRISPRVNSTCLLYFGANFEGLSTILFSFFIVSQGQNKLIPFVSILDVVFTFKASLKLLPSRLMGVDACTLTCCIITTKYIGYLCPIWRSPYTC